MIKQIQLRGISRTPSDKMSEDGGLSESLNMFMDTAENAPAFVPEDVTKDLKLPADLQAERIFIHKTANYENYITQEDDKVVAYADMYAATLLTLPLGENLFDINAVGNILILTTTESVHYILWKNDQYVYIGDQLPVPVIEFEVIGNDDEVFRGSSRGSVKLDTSGETVGRMPIALFEKDAWEKAARGVHEIEETNEYFKAFSLDFWSAVQSTKTKIGKWGYFSCPRFVRYAIKLYDGSYIYHSVPVLLGAGKNEWISVTGSYTETTTPVSSLTYQINLFYKATAKLIAWDIEGWEDIIQGVDIFISTDITYPAINEVFATCDDGGGKVYFKGYEDSFELTKQEVLSKSEFYKIKSIPALDLSSLKSGIDLHTDFDVETSETLVTKERLTSDYMASHKVVPRNISLFNNSIITNAAKIQYPSPYPLLNGLFSDINLVIDNYQDYQTPSTYQMKFHVRRNNGEEFSIMARNPEGGFDFITPLVSNHAPSALETHFYAKPMAWIAYPDPNCYKVDIYLGQGEIVSIDMSQHPSLSCAYAFIGLDQFYENMQTAADAEYDYSERTAYEVSNQVMMSMQNNPFVFPANQRYTLQASVIGTSIATEALSQGQFGQFPIYVFTEDGIWAMETAADGSFITSKPLAREVCINPDSICSIDNAVVFVTDKAVMMIQGSQVMNISPYMNGRHYVPNASAVNLISHQDGFAEFADAITDDDPFMKFMKDARTAYDYTGQRLIFISPSNTGFQYVYKIDTQTWHKMAFSGFDLEQQLNSYPECLVLGRQDKDQTYIEVTTNQAQATEDEIIDFIKSFVNVPSDKISQFINGEWALNVTNLSEEELGRLTDMLDREYHILTTTFTDIRNVSVIYDLSTVLDASRKQETAKGILITRPFDLGMPDVFKSITKIKIRGDYDKDNVKFILQGSDNGRDFYTLTSLRGKSWKMFRIFILADLEPTERISWIDIDFEPRYQNKLR